MRRLLWALMALCIAGTTQPAAAGILAPSEQHSSFAAVGLPDPLAIQALVLEEAFAIGLPDPAHFLRVAHCESRFKPDARGKQGEASIFQIHPVWQFPRFYRTKNRHGVPFTDPWQPRQNVQYAAVLFERGEQAAWSCSKLVAKESF